jgi:aminoglycoside phosphotransferase (APT) family kinase protein
MSAQGVPAGVGEVRAAHRIDEAALAAHLKAELGLDGALKLRQFEGGQSNPTYYLELGDERLVLRRKPPGELLPSAHAVDREYRVIRALRDSAVPVADGLLLCEDASVIGTVFYVMRHVPGRIFWDPQLPSLEPAERHAVFMAMAATIAELHAINPADIGLADYGASGNYLERQVSRWSRQYQASEAPPIAAMQKLIEWLPSNLPPAGEVRIVHGDLRLDNFIFDAVEPKVRALLDWELSTLGDPLVDFAYSTLTWRMPAAGFRGLAGVDIEALGIPPERAYIADYCSRRGIALGSDGLPPHWNTYLVFNLFRLAAILQGVAARALAGNAASGKAAELGRQAAPLAELAWSLVDKDTR